MDDRFNRLEAKVDKLDEKVDKTNEHLAVYNEQLKIHIAGTEDNREQIKQQQAIIVEIREFIASIKASFRTIITISKVSASLATVGGLILAAFKYFKG